MTKPKFWIETDYKGIQWRVQRVTGRIAWMLCGRSSYLAYTRLTPVPADRLPVAAADGSGREVT